MFWLISIIIVFILILKMIRNAFANNVLLEEIKSEKIIQDVTIFFISDIHKRTLSSKIIKKIQDTDIILIGGDLGERGVSLEQIERNIRKLVNTGPVYFVFGNNDYELPRAELLALLHNNGCHVLKDESRELKINEQKIQLIGLDELNHSRNKVESILSNISPERYTILLCHNPGIQKYLKNSDPIQLILNGHTHGGQIRFGTYGLYPNGGWVHSKTRSHLISNGYGTTLIPMRLGAEAQTHLIKLKSLG